MLEEPDVDEDLIIVDGSSPVDNVVAEILRELAPRLPDNREAIVARDITDRPAIPDVKTCVPQQHPGTARGTSIRSDLPLAIEDYALIDDCTAAALVGRNGSLASSAILKFESYQATWSSL
jgi:hypothetical protein